MTRTLQEKREAGRLYYANNRERIAAERRKDREDNPEKYRAQSKRYRAKHRGRRNAAQKQWMRDNRERRRIYMQEYRKKNRPSLARMNEGSRQYAETVLNDPCVYCGGESCSIDHIVPTSVGGQSMEDNFAPACKSCNSSKGSKGLLEFLLDRRNSVTIT